MRINENNKDTLERVHLLSGQDKKSTRRVFESLAFLIVQDYLEGRSTNIPFIGDIKLIHSGDESVKGGKRVQLTLDFEAEETLQKNIGQIVDGDTSDIEKMMISRIQSSIGEYINK